MKNLLVTLVLLVFTLPVFGRCISGDCTNGYGASVNDAGDKYTGEYKNGDYSGQGTYVFKDGRKYIGKWKNSQRNGKGFFYNSDGSLYGYFVWKDDSSETELPVPKNGGTRDCDGLYQGKVVNLKNHGMGAMLGSSTIPAIVLGVDKSGGMVSIKFTNSGETKEGSCYTLKQEMR